MNLEIEPYVAQTKIWPEEGRVILTQFDEETIVAYQAYRPAIGNFAAQTGCFGGPFKLTRMSWIEPNFLWMMYRCGWASKQGQEVVLAIRMLRSAFDSILAQAVHTTYKPHVYSSHDQWKDAGEQSDVRLQWDPDHAPDGSKQERRAIQLGLRGDVLKSYSKEWIVEITDVSEFVRAQNEYAVASRYDRLQMPKERVYPVNDIALIEKLGLT